MKSLQKTTSQRYFLLFLLANLAFVSYASGEKASTRTTWNGFEMLEFQFEGVG